MCYGPRARHCVQLPSPHAARCRMEGPSPAARPSRHLLCPGCRLIQARARIDPPLPPASSAHCSSSSPSPCPRPPTSRAPPACSAGRCHDGARAASPLPTFVRLQPISGPHTHTSPHLHTPILNPEPLRTCSHGGGQGSCACVTQGAPAPLARSLPVPLPVGACVAAPVLQPCAHQLPSRRAQPPAAPPFLPVLLPQYWRDAVGRPSCSSSPHATAAWDPYMLASPAVTLRAPVPLPMCGPSRRWLSHPRLLARIATAWLLQQLLTLTSCRPDLPLPHDRLPFNGSKVWH
ncbi:hypothetical protein BS78_10G146900 [Paspalum vaginatum]|nr:hypothetical protein BS78_10G146900 [Paspalum vaginatum]KAJ1259344.1 hypothetical protein BS78_10G146900 [Paspalum vaginatum]